MVNGEVITRSELDRLVGPMYQQIKKIYNTEEQSVQIEKVRKKALNRLIEEKLVISEAKKRGIEAAEAEIKQRLDHVKGRFGSGEEFDSTLYEQNVSLSDLRELYANQIIASKLLDEEVRSKISISPSQINEYFEAHKEEFEEAM